MKARDLSMTFDAATSRLSDLMSMAFAKWITTTAPSDVWQTCATCSHMSKKGPAYCSKFNMVPPAVVITGDRNCEAYNDDEVIPF